MGHLSSLPHSVILLGLQNLCYALAQIQLSAHTALVKTSIGFLSGGSGIRTHNSRGVRILSPLRKPFRHTPISRPFQITEVFKAGSHLLVCHPGLEPGTS